MVNKMPDDEIELSSLNERVQNIAISSFKMERADCRFMKTLLLFSKKTGQEEELISSYFEVFKDEKEYLLQLLNAQLKKAKELNAPPLIMEEQVNKCHLAQEVVDQLNQFGAKEFFKYSITDLDDKITQQLINMSAKFVANEEGIDYMDSNTPEEIDLLNTLYKT